MKVIHINTCSYGSTGNIAIQLCKCVETEGGTSWLCVPNGRHNQKKYTGNHCWIGGRWSEDSHLLLSRMTGFNGYFSVLATHRFLREVDKINPDIVHLHNLHNAYINLPMLFRYLKKRALPVVWTLHDCWTFTGQCPHFTIAKCEKWKNGCFSCPQYRNYPQSYVDNTKWMYKKKKQWFTGLEKAILVTPSQWLAGLVQASFLQDYPVRVIHNGIDLDMFKPCVSDFRRRYGISEEKHIVLGVSFGWSYGKGLDVFQTLAERLNPAQYQIVLVGTDPKTERSLHGRILSIQRTQDRKELAEIYSSADVFINPTREENYPTVNMEAIACGTPVVTFQTGGSAEIPDVTCGCAVPCDDIDTLKREIIRVCKDRAYTKEACMARGEQFDQKIACLKYMSVYREIMHDGASKL